MGGGEAAGRVVSITQPKQLVTDPQGIKTAIVRSLIGVIMK